MDVEKELDKILEGRIVYDEYRLGNGKLTAFTARFQATKEIKANIKAAFEEAGYMQVPEHMRSEVQGEIDFIESHPLKDAPTPPVMNKVT